MGHEQKQPKASKGEYIPHKVDMATVDIPDGEYVLGYRAMGWPPPQCADMTAEVKDRFLYNLGSQQVVTLDEYRWEDEIVDKYEEFFELDDYRRPYGQPIAWDLEYLQEVLKQPPAGSLPKYRILALTVSLYHWDEPEYSTWDEKVGDGQGSKIGLNDLEGHSTLDNIDTSGWTFLGYDIADAFGTSGLSNCGGNGVGDNRSRFSGQINTSHLFSEQEDAEGFRYFANESIKEHAPFFIYGIWDTGIQRTN